MKLLTILKFLLKFIIAFLLVGMVSSLAVYYFYSKNLPDVSQLKIVRLQTPMKVLSQDGELIATFGERRRLPLKYEDIPPIVLKAVIATEDSRFYEHFGVDPVGITRAVYNSIKSHSFSQGGSTITQQVAKNFFLTPEKSISRKIKEMILAIRMEKELSKEEIITLYLNMINFGSRAYGVGSASYTFFGKQASELTLSEAALLAGLPNAPSAYNPIYHPEKALSRRNWVLYRMLDENDITEEEYNQAINEPLSVKYHTPKISFSAPYVAEMARQFMYDKFGENAYTDGYTVYTTITKKDQLAAEQAVHNQLIQYDIRHGYRGAERVLWKENSKPLNNEEILSALNNYMCYDEICPAVVIQSDQNKAKVLLANNREITLDFNSISWARAYIDDDLQGPLPTDVSSVVKRGEQIWVKQDGSHWLLSQIPKVNGAFVSMDSNNGQIKALIGGFNFHLNKFNRVTQATRQIGSNIKPFIYTAAIDDGLTLATLLNDSPIMRSAGSDVWRPKNSPANYQGPLRLRVGLNLSKNVMMVRALRAIGIDYAADYLERFGFPKENISHHESLALGSASFTPLQVVRAYSVIANGGYLISPYIIDKIEYSEGGTIYQHESKIACNSEVENNENNCPIDSIYHKNGKGANLDNAENEVDSNDAEVPDESSLKNDNDTLFPDRNLALDHVINTTDGSVNESNQVPSIYAPHVISSDVAFIIKDALKTSIWGDPDGQWLGTAWRSRILKRDDIGGKTGTTNASKDVWFSGFAGNTVATVWIGFDDHRKELGKARLTPLNANGIIKAEGGAVTANPVWNEYMATILQGVPQVQDKQPSTVISVLIDKQTGYLANQPGKDSINEYFIEGTEPTKYVVKEVGTKIIDKEGKTSELF